MAKYFLIGHGTLCKVIHIITFHLTNLNWFQMEKGFLVLVISFNWFCTQFFNRSSLLIGQVSWLGIWLADFDNIQCCTNIGDSCCYNNKVLQTASCHFVPTHSPQWTIYCTATQSGWSRTCWIWSASIKAETRDRNHDITLHPPTVWRLHRPKINQG